VHLYHEIMWNANLMQQCVVSQPGSSGELIVDVVLGRGRSSFTS